MTLPASHYSRDPLDILLERESRSCKGCAHLDTMVILGEQALICNKAKKPTRKCSQYRERE